MYWPSHAINTGADLSNPFDEAALECAQEVTSECCTTFTMEFLKSCARARRLDIATRTP